MSQSSGAMTWSEGMAALLTFSIIIFLLWVCKQRAGDRGQVGCTGACVKAR
jgi:hypothetical protein